MYKLLLILLITISYDTIAMDHDEELRPRYHIDNSVVFLQKSNDKEERKETNEQSIDKQRHNANRHTPLQIATIDNGVSNKIKITIAVIGSCATITAAIISSIITYYSSKKC